MCLELGTRLGYFANHCSSVRCCIQHFILKFKQLHNRSFITKGNSTSVQFSFLFCFVFSPEICWDFFENIVQCSPVAFSKVWNSEFSSIEWLPPNAKEEEDTLRDLVYFYTSQKAFFVKVNAINKYYRSYTNSTHSLDTIS